jgi:hypothetical protein
MMCRSMQKKMDPPGRCSSSGVCVGIRQGVLLCSSGHAAWPRFWGVETHYWQRFAALDGVRLAPCAAECSWTAIAISTGTQARHGLVGRRGGCGCLCEGVCLCAPAGGIRLQGYACMQCGVAAAVCMHALCCVCQSDMLLHAAGVMCARRVVSLHPDAALVIKPVCPSLRVCGAVYRPQGLESGCRGDCDAGLASLSNSAVVVLCSERSLLAPPCALCLLAVLVVWFVSRRFHGGRWSAVRFWSANTLLGLLRLWAQTFACSLSPRLCSPS